jgi:hypothetical protein
VTTAHPELLPVCERQHHVVPAALFLPAL